MNIQQLQYFVTVAELEHMTKAAQQLHISQPALTASIQRLEAELEAKLFAQTGRNITLTDCGKAFLPCAVSAIESIETGQKKIADVRKKKQGIVRLVTPPIASYPGLLNKLLSQCPNLIMSNEKDAPELIRSKLKNNSIDLCISAMLFESDDIEYCVLSNEKLMLLIPKSNPLSKQSSVSFPDLKDQDFSAFPATSGPFQQMLKYCSNAGFSPNVKFTGERLADVMNSVYYCNTVAVMTTETKTDYSDNIHPELTWVPIDGEDCFLQRRLYWRKNEDRTAILTAREMIIEYFDNEWKINKL